MGILVAVQWSIEAQGRLMVRDPETGPPFPIAPGYLEHHHSGLYGIALTTCFWGLILGWMIARYWPRAATSSSRRTVLWGTISLTAAAEILTGIVALAR